MRFDGNQVIKQFTISVSYYCIYITGVPFALTNEHKYMFYAFACTQELSFACSKCFHACVFTVVVTGHCFSFENIFFNFFIMSCN